MEFKQNSNRWKTLIPDHSFNSIIKVVILGGRPRISSNSQSCRHMYQSEYDLESTNTLGSSKQKEHRELVSWVMENRAKKLKRMMWRSRDQQEEKIPPLRTLGRSGVTQDLKPEVKEDTTSERHNKKLGRGARSENCSLSSCPRKVLVAQSCSTLCDPMGCSLVHGVLQARILEWVAIPFSRESSQPRD